MLPVKPGPWSHGPLLLPEDLPLERAIFVEPFGDCLHAVIDQARIERGQRLVVVGGGQMGLQLVLAGVLEGAEIALVEPHEERRGLGPELGAARRSPTEFADVSGKAELLSSFPSVLGALVERCVGLAAPGGHVVLFAGSATSPRAELDLNRLHYQEIAVVGSEWIGTRRTSGARTMRPRSTRSSPGGRPLERLVTGRYGLEGLRQRSTDVQELAA